GPTDLELINLSNAYLVTYLQKGFLGKSTIGEAMRAGLRDPAFPPTPGANRLTSLGNTLLGDPALPFPTGVPPSATRAAAAWSGVGEPSSVEDRTIATPNPAQTETHIVLESLPGGGAIDVSVLDVSGRCVRTLVHDESYLRTRELSWDLRD